MYKFTGKKYVTNGIKQTVPDMIVMYLFHLIEARKAKTNIPMDYLQVIEIAKVNNAMLLISHKQEEPVYIETHLLNYNLDLEAKVYVIDDIEYVTMLLASEY